jgi:hypothetical protein
MSARAKTTLPAPWLLHAIPQSEPLNLSSELLDKLTGHFAVAGALGVKPKLICGIIWSARSIYNMAHSRAAVRARSARLGGAAAVERAIEVLKQEELLACEALMMDDFTDDELVAKAVELRKFQPQLSEAQAFAKAYNDLNRKLSKPARERQAWAKYQGLLRNLGSIASTMQTSRGSVKRRGKPPQRDLDRVVGYLAACWEEIVGPGTFTAKWETKTRRPLTPAGAFVREIVEFIDSARLPEVRKAMERVIRRARKQHPHTPRSAG